MTTQRVDDLRAALASAGADYVNVCGRLALGAADVASLDAQLRAAENAAGIARSSGPEVRALCADVMHGAVAPLRPCVPFVSQDTAARAAVLLNPVHDDAVDERHQGDSEDVASRSGALKVRVEVPCQGHCRCAGGVEDAGAGSHGR